MLITLRAQREDFQQQLRAQWQDFQQQLQPAPEQVLPMMAYTGRFRPKGVPLVYRRYKKGVPFQASGIYKGRQFHLFKYMKE